MSVIHSGVQTSSQCNRRAIQPIPTRSRALSQRVASSRGGWRELWHGALAHAKPPYILGSCCHRRNILVQPHDSFGNRENTDSHMDTNHTCTPTLLTIRSGRMGTRAGDQGQAKKWHPVSARTGTYSILATCTLPSSSPTINTRALPHHRFAPYPTCSRPYDYPATSVQDHATSTAPCAITISNSSSGQRSTGTSIPAAEQ